MYRVPEKCGPEDGYWGIFNMMGRANESVVGGNWVFYEAPADMWEGWLRDAIEGNIRFVEDVRESIKTAQSKYLDYCRENGGLMGREGRYLNMDRKTVGEFIYNHLLNMAPDRVLVVWLGSTYD